MAPIFYEKIYLSNKISLTARLKIYQATFEDSIFNPFESDEEPLIFLKSDDF